MKIPFQVAKSLRLLVGLSTLATSLFAQAVDSNLVGIVTDPTGASVANATVTAANKDTGVKYAGVTDSAGEYRINHIPVGLYDVTATADRFAAATTANVTQLLNWTNTVNFRLRVATVSTAIEVVDAPPPINQATAQIGTTMQAGAISQLQLGASGSGLLNLSLLTAGVASAGGLGYGFGPSVGGQRPASNAFFVEGTDSTSHYSPGPLAYIPADAVAEFSSLQNHFGAEFGGAAGGIFNIAVKSGGNQIHGSLYEYMQNRNLDALDSSEANQGLKSPPRFDSNRLGATIGGPIIKNKLFYFGSFEYNPIGYTAPPSQIIDAPTAVGYQMLDSMSGLSKTNLQVLQKYLPAAPANDAGTTQVLNANILIGSLSIAPPAYQNNYRAVGNIDWNVSDRDQFRGRYIYSRFTGLDTNTSLPAFFVQMPNDTHVVSLSEFHNFSPSTENELRLSYSRNNNWISTSNFTFPGLDSFPTIVIDQDLGATLGPDPSAPSGTTQDELQASENISKMWGRHMFKAGYEFHDIIMSSSSVSYPRGYYWYSGLNQYLQDLTPDEFAQRTLGTTGPLTGGIPAGFLQHAAYFNDDFRVHPNLTLNIGMRYELDTVPVAERAQQYSALANVPGVLTFGAPTSAKNNWSPRLGIAWSPGSDGVWSIRAGFGRAFDTPYSNIALNTLPAFYGSVVNGSYNNAPNFLANGGLSTPPALPTTPALARAGITTYSPDQELPYALNYTVSIQRILAKDYTVEVRYLGTKGVHLPIQEQLGNTSPVTATQNLPTFLSAPTAAQLAGLKLNLGNLNALKGNALVPAGFTSLITAYEPLGNSNYNGLALQVTKRYSKKFSYIAAYTWSHNMDDSSDPIFTSYLSPRRPQDNNNLSSEWASSALDRRHRLAVTPIYDIVAFQNGNWLLKNVVGNWTVSGTYTYESPEYGTVQSGIDSNLNGDTAGDRAIVNPAGNANIGSGVQAVDINGNPVKSGSTATVAYYATTPNARYILAGPGAYATGGRNTFPFSPIDNVDASLVKKFSFRERTHFEVGGQFYNLFNHAQFSPGYVNDVGQVRYAASRNFLIPGNASFGNYQAFFSDHARYIQLMARITF